MDWILMNLFMRMKQRWENDKRADEQTMTAGRGIVEGNEGEEEEEDEEYLKRLYNLFAINQVPYKLLITITTTTLTHTNHQENFFAFLPSSL